MRYTIVLMLTSLVAADQLVTRACRELGNSCSSDADCCVNGFRNVGCRSKQIPAPQNPRVPPVGLSRGRFRWFRKVSRDLASLPEADIAPRSDDEEDEGAGYGDYTGAL
ncbi:uncharacterized protein UV8b_04552 [Ustilaginoidea virens]|uniref:Uncharacterized protein n=1 Tax=Ustilaginoidea virens TaxID=1159556 RepID=A0A8E5MHU4_USTVR|nr:uncharacterized protein UV8b_04552 [Ustilaginoidea virens]QUC20311.1 hypothetical protein UV8b_04552 [Ustilaginoidea virens]